MYDPLSLGGYCQTCYWEIDSARHDAIPETVPRHERDGRLLSTWERSNIARERRLNMQAIDDTEESEMPPTKRNGQLPSNAQIGVRKASANPSRVAPEQDLVRDAQRERAAAIELDHTPTRQQQAYQAALQEATTALRVTTITVRCLRATAKYENDSVEMTVELQPGQDPVTVTAALRQLCESTLKTSRS